MAAECLQSEIASITTCSICLEKHTIPKYLPCLHTFCECCILEYISSGFEKGNETYIECPVCRTTVSNPKEKGSPEEWAKSLPLNFLIVGLLENEKVQRPERLCMICERIGKNAEAISVCVDCSDLLCIDCTEYHKVIKFTSGHKINALGETPLDVNSVKTFKNFCLEHKNKELELHCVDHEIPCCSMCVSIHHRKCEKVLSLEDAAKGIATSDIVKDINQHFTYVDEDINTVIIDRKACLQYFETKYETEKKKLLTLFDDFITKVSSLKAKRESELAKLYNEVKENLNTTLTIFQNKEKIIKNEKQILTISLSKASEVQLMIEIYKLKNQLSKHKDLIHNAWFEFKEYTLLVKNPHELSSILEELENVCQIKCYKKLNSLVFQSNIDLRRSDIHECNRFQTMASGVWVVNNADAISFSVSRAIKLYGFLSYGCADGSSTCEVTASLHDGSSDIATVTTTLDAESTDDKLFPIYFPKPIKLEANKNYHAVMMMIGPHCNYGESGLSKVDCNSVVFTFQNSEMDKNETNTFEGELPGFLFKLY